VRDITSSLLKEVCRDVRVEPSLLELNGEELNRQANRTREARLDVSASGFWIPGQRVFLDVRVFDLSAQRDTGVWNSQNASNEMKMRKKRSTMNEYFKWKMGRLHH
jgi:hypothetical protein